MGARIVHLGQSGCPPLFEIERVGYTDNDRCDGVNRKVLEAVGTDPGITHVVLSFRGAAQVSGTGFGSVDGQLRTRYRLIGSDVGNADAIHRPGRNRGYLLAHRKECDRAPDPELGFSPMGCAAGGCIDTRTPCVRTKRCSRTAIRNTVDVAAPAEHTVRSSIFCHICDDRKAGLTDDQMLIAQQSLTLTGSRLGRLALQLAFSVDRRW